MPKYAEPVTLVVSGETYHRGNGNLCANCHQARRCLKDFESTTTPGSYESPNIRFHPHLSVQSDMLLGLPGAGVEGQPGAHYSMVENTCVGCHLGEGDNHLFEPQLARCQECHADAESLDINGFQASVEERLAEGKRSVGRWASRCRRRWNVCSCTWNIHRSTGDCSLELWHDP